MYVKALFFQFLLFGENITSLTDVINTFEEAGSMTSNTWMNIYKSVINIHVWLAEATLEPNPVMFGVLNILLMPFNGH